MQYVVLVASQRDRQLLDRIDPVVVGDETDDMAVEPGRQFDDVFVLPLSSGSDQGRSRKSGCPARDVMFGMMRFQQVS